MFGSRERLYNAWVRDHYRFLFRSAWALTGSRAVAEEVVQGGGDVAVLGARLATLDDQEMTVAGVAEPQRTLYSRLCPMVENSAGLYRYLTKRSPV